MGKLAGKPFEGLPAQLYRFLSDVAGIRVAEKWWPADPTRLGHALTKLEAPLRMLGLIVKRGERTNKGKPYLITRAGDAGPAPVTLEDVVGDTGFETSVT